MYRRNVIVHYTIPCHAGHSHIHIVQPHRVVMRTVTGEDSVGQSVLLVADEVHVTVYHRTVSLVCLCHVKAAVSGCHRTAIVQCTGEKHHSHLRVVLFVLLQGLGFFRRLACDEAETVCGEAGETFIAGLLSCVEHGGIQHSSLVGRQSEAAFRKFVALCRGGHRLFKVCQHAVNGCLHLRFRRYAIRGVILWLHQVQRSVLVINLVLR